LLHHLNRLRDLHRFYFLLFLLCLVQMEMLRRLLRCYLHQRYRRRLNRHHHLLDLFQNLDSRRRNRHQ
jgi:hypothetical protein